MQLCRYDMRGYCIAKSSSPEDILYLTGDTHGQFDRISLFCRQERPQSAARSLFSETRVLTSTAVPGTRSRKTSSRCCPVLFSASTTLMSGTPARSSSISLIRIMAGSLGGHGISQYRICDWCWANSAAIGVW